MIENRLIRFLLIFFIAFSIVFLLWPSYVLDPNDSPSVCDDTGLLNTSSNCAPPYRKVVGGGFSFISSKIRMLPSDPADDVHFFHFSDGYFEPLQALIGSLIISGGVAIISVTIIKPKKRKT
jgi:hypothetical protein